MMKWNFNNSYIHLPPALLTRQKPTAVENPKIAKLNLSLINELGLGSYSESMDLMTLAGNHLPEGSEPLAQAYSGHQFGHYNNLGDGRAILIGEHLTPAGLRFDIQLKGSGPTPYSRRGDGRASLGPMLREYLISEAMHALGIPTTRSLAVVTTGESVYRETVMQGAVLCRVAASHLRVGTFQFAASLNDHQVLKTLADYTIQRHFPELSDSDQPYVDLIKKVCAGQASLVAKWLNVGFIHGVMNTDNMSICGESIDYGPCAFMDQYDPATVFSSIDREGRYAYGKQPAISEWNLTRFAECLLPLLDSDLEKATELAQEALSVFSQHFETLWTQGLFEKLAFKNTTADDFKFIDELLRLIYKHKFDYTYFWRNFATNQVSSCGLFNDEEFKTWLAKWKTRASAAGRPFEDVKLHLNMANPIIIPRNHLVEAALKDAVEQGNYSKFNRLLNALSEPFKEINSDSDLYQIPTENQKPYKTFCGT
jgi:uncharacterized protein YdiU (UPF0061 family)